MGMYPAQIAKIFNQKISGLLSYEEIEKRCIDLSRESGIDEAIFEITFFADVAVSYQVDMKWTSGAVRKRDRQCSVVFGSKDAEPQNNTFGRKIDIEVQIRTSALKPHHDSSQRVLRSHVTTARNLGMKTPFGYIDADENGAFVNDEKFGRIPLF
jgi:hypothetical protein